MPCCWSFLPHKTLQKAVFQLTVTSPQKNINFLFYLHTWYERMIDNFGCLMSVSILTLLLMVFLILLLVYTSRIDCKLRGQNELWEKKCCTMILPWKVFMKVEFQWNCWSTLLKTSLNDIRYLKLSWSIVLAWNNGVVNHQKNLEHKRWNNLRLNREIKKGRSTISSKMY